MDELLRRYKPGKPAKYPTPEALWKIFVKYVDFYKTHPLYKHEAKVVDKAIEISKTPKMRLLAVSSFCMYANISSETFRRHRTGEHGSNEFIDVCNQIVEHIQNSRHEGASADLLNANYVARLNGLADNVNNVNFNSVQMTPEELKRISKQLDEEL